LARDDFSKETKDILAKRVGMKCSNPGCRKPTSGPDAKEGVTNGGVAAHISAASPRGARYDKTLTPEQRRHKDNGIWLCQYHAKLIDDDELTYTPTVLRGWKDEAEKIAAVEVLGYTVKKVAPFSSLEKQCPALLAKMRQDLSNQPLVREFMILSKDDNYNYSSKRCFEYFLEDHEDLESLMTIMQHKQAIYAVPYNDVPRYNFTEDFVSYLNGEIS
jgi:hypothetical protein